MASAASGRKFFVLQTGGLGDLVLLSELVAALKTADPAACVTLACRAPFVSLIQCYPEPPDQVLGLSFDPFRWALPDDRFFAELLPARETLQAHCGGLFIAAEFKPTWFDWFAAAAVGAERAVYCSDVSKPRGLLPAALERHGLQAPVFEGPEFEPGCHERNRYRRILSWLGISTADGFPWSLPKLFRQQTERKLSELGLQPGQYLACCPFGGAGTVVKRWPVDRFREVLLDFQREFAMPVLLTGSADEEGELREFAAGLGNAARKPAVFAGAENELPLLAGLLALSRAYFGNDTGPMHLAAAYDIPGVAIYGGGAWPSYSPWSKGSIGFVRPMPCFGCTWDCMFGRGYCVEGIPVDAVAQALRDVICNPPAEAETRTAAGFPSEVEGLIAAASTRYREAQRDRRERLESIVAFEAALGELRQQQKQHVQRERELVAEIELLRQAAAERLAALDATTEAANAARANAAEIQKRLDTVDQAAAERLTALEITSAALEAARAELTVLNNETVYQHLLRYARQRREKKAER